MRHDFLCVLSMGLVMMCVTIRKESKVAFGTDRRAKSSYELHMLS